ncbi:DUF262 domain-containing protein [Cellulosimicrobium sp. I38E]|uniref:DUF262 domain-containing protein n=1 Tax=Cellulosimicrobium sp. I38E TaxID=1393139 RepID=UPI0007B222A4|nr:DUF262 domain-containing protein [Cellulosimicrobium sp. I38E]KZM78445.1 hypothetical protein A0J59_13295 [Cellulosimicrobium sp. I38E]
MHASNSNVKSLIEGSKVFTVPLYQRRYSWKRDNWKELWQDILEQYDFMQNEGAQPTVTHFIGSFVLAPTGNESEHSKLVVVDGQQRLTTFMILLAALRDELASREATSEGRRKVESKYNQLYLQNVHAESEDEALRLLPTQQDRSEFRACVGQTPATPMDGLIGEAYDFFRSDEALQGPDLLGAELNLRQVSDVIIQRLTLVQIVTEPGDSVHQIFQTLNHAGVKLKQVDLLRNHFFMLLPTRGEQLYAKVWRRMELRIGESALDRFFWANLVRRDARVTRNDVYTAMQRRLDKVAKDEDAVASILLEFSEDLEAYAALTASATGSTRIDDRLAFINAWGVDTAQPVMLELVVRWRRGALTSEDVDEALMHIESFVVRRMICGVPTNNLNRLFTSMASVMADPGFGPNSLAAFLAGERKYWPTDREVERSATARNFESGGRPWQRIMLLERLLSNETETSRDPAIVRIAPSEISGDWLQSFGDEGEGPSALYRQLAGTLGNLTLIDSAAAGQLAADWPARRIQLGRLGDAGASGPQRNSYWSSYDIQQRARVLARRIIQLWPRPSGEATAAEGERPVSLESVLRSLPSGASVTIDDLAEVLARKQSALLIELAQLEPRLRQRVVSQPSPTEQPTLGYAALLELVDGDV